MKHFLSFLFFTFLTLTLIWGLGWLWFATGIAISAPDKSMQHADAIIVLTGGNGRINAGLDLLASDKADQLLISGVHDGTTEADIMAGWINRNGRTPCCLTLGYSAQDTIGNALEVREWVQKNAVQSFILVTSSYHMPRAKMELSQALDQTIRILPYPVLTPDFEPWKGRFWTLSFSEYNKTLIRWLQALTHRYAP